jgi:hypothetical protein
MPSVSGPLPPVGAAEQKPMARPVSMGAAGFGQSKPSPFAAMGGMPLRDALGRGQTGMRSPMPQPAQGNAFGRFQMQPPMGGAMRATGGFAGAGERNPMPQPAVQSPMRQPMPQPPVRPPASSVGMDGGLTLGPPMPPPSSSFGADQPSGGLQFTGGRPPTQAQGPYGYPSTADWMRATFGYTF